MTHSYRNTLVKLNDSIIAAETGGIASLIKTNPRISTEKQLAVYIDGYRIRLSNAVKTDYPALCFFLGGGIDELIENYIRETNSNFYSLDFYPFQLANYLLQTNIPQAAKELAQLESAIAKIFLEKDSEPLKAEKLLSLKEKDMNNLTFKPRTASALLVFENNVEEFLQKFRAGKKPLKIKAAKTCLYIVRHENEIKRHVLSEDEAELLLKLREGETLQKALSSIKKDISADFPEWLQKWLVNGFFAS